RCSEACLLIEASWHTDSVWIITPLGTRGACGALLFLFLLLLDDLALDQDLNLVADDPFAVEHYIECQAEVLAVDLALGTVADTVAHPGIVELAIAQPIQRDLPGVALDGQVAGHGITVRPGRFDLGALERDGRIHASF